MSCSTNRSIQGDNKKPYTINSKHGHEHHASKQQRLKEMNEPNTNLSAATQNKAVTSKYVSYINSQIMTSKYVAYACSQKVCDIKA